MKLNLRSLLPLSLLILASCSSNEYLSKGREGGLSLAYKWNHPIGKPSELLLRLKNEGARPSIADLRIDLLYQGRTVEFIEVDTCVRNAQTLTGKLNGLYFIPNVVTTEQIKAGDVDVEVSRFLVSDTTACPREENSPD